MGFKHLWAQTGCQGEGTTVAVIDTGVHATHPSLANKVSDFVIVDPLGNEVRSQSPFDAGQHGTHVCGTIVGEPDPNGVIIGGAPGAKLIVAAALMGHATVRTIINAISWAAQQGADIITMSLGLQRYEPKFEDLPSPLLTIYGILPIVAIGNASHGNTSTPGNVHSAFAVGALDGRDVASFSGGASLDFPGTDQPKIVAGRRSPRGRCLLLRTANRRLAGVCLPEWHVNGGASRRRRCCGAHVRQTGGRCQPSR